MIYEYFINRDSHFCKLFCSFDGFYINFNFWFWKEIILVGNTISNGDFTASKLLLRIKNEVIRIGCWFKTSSAFLWCKKFLFNASLLKKWTSKCKMTIVFSCLFTIFSKNYRLDWVTENLSHTISISYLLKIRWSATNSNRCIFFALIDHI